ncbi:MAG: TIGR00730 family Rossman fold protein [Bacteroidales bacterium]|nr:TIGR00730 family Rossman fold protein [Bacteroidales bacterium]
MKIKSICVFCGSATGNNPEFHKAAYGLGKLLAENNISLIYGGAKVGMMGMVADGALENNGRVIGVLPVFFKEKEIAHDKIDEMILVDSMHERKQIMLHKADAFVALPGGFGTLDEISEILTLAQLGKYQKPLGFLNSCNYFDSFFNFVDVMHQYEFIGNAHKGLFISSDTPLDLLLKLEKFNSPVVRKWIKE